MAELNLTQHEADALFAMAKHPGGQHTLELP